MSESRGRSRKHKLSCLRDRADSLDITSDGNSSIKGNSCGESDEVNNYFCHQLSTLSIPTQRESCGTGSYDYPPRKKLKRRKNRKAKRTRVKSAVQISESSDVTPTSPISCHLKSNTSDDTMVEVMSTGGCSSDSSLSLGHVTDLGGTDADDELSCWEGCGAPTSCNLFSSGDETTVDSTESKKKEPARNAELDFLNKTLAEVRHADTGVRQCAPQLKTVARREKMKTRTRPAARDHGGSSTSSPSMTKDQASTMDRAIKRRYVVDYMSVVDGAGPSNAMQTGD